MEKNHLIVNARKSLGTIRPELYGQFSEHLGRCIYEGLYVREEDCIPNVNGMRSDVVNALKKLHIPVLRWPGGCFADTYHWQDGIGPKENRKTIVNTNWGGVTEDNAFGTHEFMELCRQLGCQPYLSGNVGSGTVQEFSDWIEYCNMGGQSPMADLRRRNGREEPWNVKYWGVGNEPWGCGGNMRAAFYADLTRQYTTYMRDYDPAHKLFRIACGGDYEWTRTVAEIAGDRVDAISLHHYTVPTTQWEHKGAATGFTRSEYFSTMVQALRMEELVENHSRILRHYWKGNHKIGLSVDEWGTWFDTEPGTNPGFLYQQNTVRDAIVAGVSLNIFNNHCDTVVMANIAQMVNVLQAMVLTEGPRMTLTPTYHVFDLYQGHMGARQLETYAEAGLLRDGETELPALHLSASEKDGKILITVVNLDETACADCRVLLGGAKAASVSARTVGGDLQAYNTFDHPDNVVVRDLAVTPVEDGRALNLTLPAASVAAITVEEA